MTIDVQKLISDLQGTCKSLDEALEFQGAEFEDMTTENCEELDSEIMQCNTCSWWSEIHDLCEHCDDTTCKECCTDHNNED